MTCLTPSAQSVLLYVSHVEEKKNLPKIAVNVTMHQDEPIVLIHLKSSSIIDPTITVAN